MTGSKSPEITSVFQARPPVNDVGAVTPHSGVHPKKPSGIGLSDKRPNDEIRYGDDALVYAAMRREQTSDGTAFDRPKPGG